MIDQFRGEYRWLSNFWPAEVVLYGKTYPTIEHAYQAAKCADPADRDWICGAVSAGIAKKRGREVKKRWDWEFVKLWVMADLLRQKFAPKTILANKLLATGDQKLVESNSWGDTFWGVCGGKGHNHLGKLLMKIRSELGETSNDRSVAGGAKGKAR